MSGGAVCKCQESRKHIKSRDWVILDYKCNHSAFSGYQKTRSDYSALKCQVCGARWRTKADYVEDLKFEI